MEVKNLMTFTDRTGLRGWFERNHPLRKMLLGCLQRACDAGRRMAEKI